MLICVTSGGNTRVLSVGGFAVWRFVCSKSTLWWQTIYNHVHYIYVNGVSLSKNLVFKGVFNVYGLIGVT